MAVKGGGGLSESVKKRKFVTKVFCTDNIEWSSKNLWKVVFDDVKAKVQEIKDLVTVSYKYL